MDALKRRSRTLTGKEIQATRRALGESVDAFGARFAASGRSVNNWESNHRRPRPLVARMIRELAAQAKTRGPKSCAGEQA